MGERLTRGVLALYGARAVEPIVESKILGAKDIEQLRSLISASAKSSTFHFAPGMSQPLIEHDVDLNAEREHDRIERISKCSQAQSSRALPGRPIRRWGLESSKGS